MKSICASKLTLLLGLLVVSCTPQSQDRKSTTSRKTQASNPPAKECVLNLIALPAETLQGMDSSFTRLDNSHLAFLTIPVNEDMRKSLPSPYNKEKLIFGLTDSRLLQSSYKLSKTEGSIQMTNILRNMTLNHLLKSQNDLKKYDWDNAKIRKFEQTSQQATILYRLDSGNLRQVILNKKNGNYEFKESSEISLDPKNSNQSITIDGSPRTVSITDIGDDASILRVVGKKGKTLILEKQDHGGYKDISSTVENLKSNTLVFKSIKDSHIQKALNYLGAGSYFRSQLERILRIAKNNYTTIGFAVLGVVALSVTLHYILQEFLMTKKSERPRGHRKPKLDNIFEATPSSAHIPQNASAIPIHPETGDVDLSQNIRLHPGKTTGVSKTFNSCEI